MAAADALSSPNSKSKKVLVAKLTAVAPPGSFEESIPARKPAGRPRNKAASHMEKPGAAAIPAPAKKKDPVAYFTMELKTRSGLAFNKWLVARKAKDGLIEVGKVAGFNPDGPYWRVQYEPVGNAEGDHEDLDQTEMAKALALNYHYGGDPHA